MARKQCLAMQDMLVRCGLAADSYRKSVVASMQTLCLDVRYARQMRIATRGIAAQIWKMHCDVLQYVSFKRKQL